MMHSIQDLLPVEGSTVEINYYFGTDPNPKKEVVVWSDDILYNYHVTEWKTV